MKPLVILVALAIGGSAMGVGFLNAPSIEVIAQQVGVGETDLTAPIDTVNVGFKISKTVNNIGDQFKNFYEACEIKSPEVILSESIIFCKLTDMQDRIVNEGFIVLTHDLAIGDKIDIPVMTSPSAVQASLVQNIHDVMIVVQGPAP